MLLHLYTEAHQCQHAYKYDNFAVTFKQLVSIRKKNNKEKIITFSKVKGGWDSPDIYTSTTTPTSTS